VVVDMPGYADNSRFRELINFHYIQTVTRCLEEVRFVIVINMTPREGGKFEIDHHDLKMMESFCEMFPETNGIAPPISLIVNKLDHPDSKDLANNVRSSLFACLNDKEIEKHINNVAKVRKYFTSFSSANFHIILKPKYPEGGKNGKTTWNESGKLVRDQMIKICNQSDAKFIPAKNIKAKLNIFKEGDASGNARLEKTVLHILKNIKEGVTSGFSFFHKTIARLLEPTKDYQNKIEEDCLAFLSHYKWFEREVSLKEWDRNEALYEVRLLK
jgi:hypothetical protein